MFDHQLLNQLLAQQVFRYYLQTYLLQLKLVLIYSQPFEGLEKRWIISRKFRKEISNSN